LHLVCNDAATWNELLASSARASCRSVPVKICMYYSFIRIQFRQLLQVLGYEVPGAPSTISALGVHHSRQGVFSTVSSSCVWQLLGACSPTSTTSPEDGISCITITRAMQLWGPRTTLMDSERAQLSTQGSSVSSQHTQDRLSSALRVHQSHLSTLRTGSAQHSGFVSLISSQHTQDRLNSALRVHQSQSQHTQGLSSILRVHHSHMI
jgi:hypothetical protein